MTMPSFADFYRDTYGRDPFPWQSRLAKRVVETGWPGVLDIPTGCGKTTTIDIAIYALAHTPERAPRRVFLVVDRRIVVDQAAAHGQELLSRLKGGAAPEIATRLRSLFAGDPEEDPFRVATLRGGMPRERDWAARPDQPVIGASTVDQVGSRLLFRGYGVSSGMAPVHAGLIGNDTLLLLDEVHLARPFAETARAIQTRWRGGALRDIDRFTVVRMSATTDLDEENAFRLDASDRADPVLARRLGATKRAKLEAVGVSGSESKRRGAFAQRCAAGARAFVERGASVVGVVVNRVATARSVHAALAAESGRAHDAVLLTGRMRPLDRDEALRGESGVLARASASRPRTERPCPRPLVIVATQCIEAGADLDLDALITECASLDALRQRFGRVDRRGELGTTDSLVLIRSDQQDPRSPDPVYGEALAYTWEWLTESNRECTGFGIAEMSLPEGASLARMLAPATEAPTLLPSHLESWVQTAPVPAPDPDISLWLHGPERGAPEVQVVWRADVEDALVAGDSAVLTQALTACPPSSLEAISIPIYAARYWLSAEREQNGRDDAPELDDANNASGQETVERDGVGDARASIRWRRGGAEILNRPRDIRAGDTIVVPTSYGGIASGTWDAGSLKAVEDLGDVAQLVGRGRATLRTHPGALAVFWPSMADPIPPPPPADGSADVPLAAAVRAWVAELDWAPTSTLWGHLLPQLGKAVRAGSLRVVAVPAPSSHLVLVEGRASIRGTTEDDDGSFSERVVSLSAHCGSVQDTVFEYARNLGLPSNVVHDLELAAALHDLGKADPRFQRWMVGGSEVRTALLDELLAKSIGSRRDWRGQHLARERSGYPHGTRHELLSTALATEARDALANANDSDLVLHLVASHHGWCRPFAPAVEDPEDLEVAVTVNGQRFHGRTRHGLARVDSGVSDRFWNCVERYGWWGLAWLEAILRLADHRVSEQEGS